MVYIILFAAIMIAAINANSNGCGIKCFSCSCLYNKGGRCIRKDIVVYDNTVTGLCLHHTDNMNDRVIKPMKRAGLLEKTYATANKLAKAQKDTEDEELLKNPKAFAVWMKRHGM